MIPIQWVDHCRWNSDRSSFLSYRLGKRSSSGTIHIDQCRSSIHEKYRDDVHCSTLSRHSRDVPEYEYVIYSVFKPAKCARAPFKAIMLG